MTVLPVIVRELRASARQPFTYYLRLAGVAALLLASALFGLRYGFDSGVGRQLFTALHCTLFGAIWVLVPMLTADCISRERREGTLGLLFMTPLKGADIVVAKALAHGLRAITLWLAVLPVLTIPFLVGGVSWPEAVMSVVVNANAMCWALAAGLLASAWSKSWLRALLVAVILAFAFFLALTAGVGWLLLHALSVTRTVQIELNVEAMLVVGLGFVTNPTAFCANSTSGMGSFYLVTWVLGSRVLKMASVGQVIWALGQTTLYSLVALVLAVAAAGAKTRRSWREEPPSLRQVWLQRTFCTPVLWQPLLRRWMRWKLEHNPIGWLEQRTWSGRLVTWGWLAVLMSVYSLVLTDHAFFRHDNPVHDIIAWALAGTIAASAAGSFRRERETGVLELLLVSPLGEREIIAGRLRGLWGQFLPVTGLLLAVWFYSTNLLPNRTSDNQALLFHVTTFLSLPVFGLYYSLRCRNFLAAVLLTAVVGSLLPLSLDAAIRGLWDSSWDMRRSAGAAGYQWILMICFYNLLLARLKKRAFPLERAQLS